VATAAAVEAPSGRYGRRRGKRRRNSSHAGAAAGRHPAWLPLLLLPLLLLAPSLLLPAAEAKGITITFGNRWRTSAADAVHPPEEDDDNDGGNGNGNNSNGNDGGGREVELVAVGTDGRPFVSTPTLSAPPQPPSSPSSSSTTLVTISPPAASLGSPSSRGASAYSSSLSSSPSLARPAGSAGGADGLGGVLPQQQQIASSSSSSSSNSATADPAGAWANAWSATVTWAGDGVAQMVRPFRKAAASTTGLRGFFSKKGYFRRFGDLPQDPSLLRSKLEILAFSRLLDGIETAVRPTWVRAVNKVLHDQTVPRVSDESS
jgi:hypothetical protein